MMDVVFRLVSGYLHVPAALRLAQVTKDDEILREPCEREFGGLHTYKSYRAQAADANLKAMPDHHLARHLFITQRALQRFLRKNASKRTIARFKVCRECFSLKTAIIVVSPSTRIECQSCGFERVVETTPEWLRYASFRWDRVNVLPQDYGVDWGDQERREVEIARIVYQRLVALGKHR